MDRNGGLGQPFSVGEREKAELRQVARILFWGGSPSAFPETAELYGRWRQVFDIFEWCKDYRSGALSHLPCGGGVLSQPARLMSALAVLRDVWCERLADALKIR